MADEPGDDRRNRFLAESGANNTNNSAGNGKGNGTGTGPGNGSSTNSNGGTQRAASQPPRTGSSASPRPASFSAPRLASTFEDDELVDPDDALYDARYNNNSSPYNSALYDARYNNNSSPYNSAHSPVLSNSFGGGAGAGAGWRGRKDASADLTRSRSQSPLPPLPGRLPPPSAPAATRAGSLGGTTGRYAGSPLVWSASISSGAGGGMEDGTNMSLFVRDVGSILLDDGSFRELWERERGMGITGRRGIEGTRMRVLYMQPEDGADREPQHDPRLAGARLSR
ncbi:hypothetical protein C8R47DRAFT_1270481 [Mycena vitilis]|nr:hypothetical protein C8R47DRAFT_1270481 [Mycena vitilis]